MKIFKKIFIKLTFAHISLIYEILGSFVIINKFFSVGTPPSTSVINELVESVKRLQDENQRLINSWMK